MPELLKRLSMKGVHQSSRDVLGFSTKTPKAVTEAWAQFDVNSDGLISRTEFIAVLTRTTDGVGKHALTKEQAEMLFDEADSDGSGEIDVNEFAEAWSEMNAQYGLHHMFPSRRMSRGATFLQRATSMAKGLRKSR